MLLAVIGEINARQNALETALNEVADTGIQTILHTGNALFAPQIQDIPGTAIVALLQKFGVICVQGLRDRQVLLYQRKGERLARRLSPEEVQALSRAYQGTDSISLEWLHRQPRRRTLDLEGVITILCHGAPSAQTELLTADTPVMKLQRQREIDSPGLIICGGAPEAFSRTVDGTLFVSPGPLVTPAGEISYTLVNTEEEPWQVDFQTTSLPAN